MSEKSEPAPLELDGNLPPLQRRGRRKLRFPEQVYERVEVLAAANLSHEEIAAQVGISDKSLRKYFRQELDGGLAALEAETLELLVKQAREGNVSAIKALRAEVRERRAAATIKARERPQSQAATSTRGGVKAERQRAAAAVADAGGMFAPPPAPQLN